MKKVDKGYMKKGKKKVQFSMLRPLMITGAIVTLGVLTAWGCSTQSAYLKTEEAPKEATYKEIKIVTVTPGKEDVVPTVTERPDFDIRNLAIIGRNDEDKGENDEDDIRGEEVQGAGTGDVAEDIEPTGDSEPDPSGAERDFTEPDGEDSGTEQDDAGEPISDDGESGSDDQADADYLPDGSQQYDQQYDGVEEEAAVYEPTYEYIGEWLASAYCPCEICCGSYATGYTASGTLATEGRTVACNSLPFGTQIYIEGYGTYIVEDTGYSPYGDAWIDIFYSSHDSALAFGVREVEVYLVN